MANGERILKSWEDKATEFQKDKQKVSDNIKADLEIHVKYGGDWFVAMAKKDVVMSNLPHAIDLVSVNVAAAVRKILYDFDHQDFQKLKEEDYEVDDDEGHITLRAGEKGKDGSIMISDDDIL